MTPIERGELFRRRPISTKALRTQEANGSQQCDWPVPTSPYRITDAMLSPEPKM